MEVIINGGRSTDLEGARKRLRENYEKIASAKKQRRLIVIEPVTRTTTLMKKTPINLKKVTTTNTEASKMMTEEQRLITQSWAQAKMSLSAAKIVLPVKIPQKIYPVVKKSATPTMMTAKKPPKNKVFGGGRDHLAATGNQLRNHTPLATLDPVSLALKLETARSILSHSYNSIADKKMSRTVKILPPQQASKLLPNRRIPS